ncbi:hypothetical protein PG994_002982 [Apiospora phragmitis]|uniref:Uncharacterized protein n=1 Tax=Apiospora phragmitis TaxID=2905665 RepID=A0ABR1W9M2_9PEZI
MTDLDGTSSTVGEEPAGASALSTLVANEGLPQGLNVNSGGDDYDIPDAAADLRPTTSHAASGSQYSSMISPVSMAMSSRGHHRSSSHSLFALSSRPGSDSQSWESFIEDAVAPILDQHPPSGKRSWSMSGAESKPSSS